MPKKKNISTLSRDIEFLYEIGSLRFVDRTWKQFFHEQMANNAEHIFRVIWIALVIARHEKVVNEEKIMKMALLHDIGESRTPDTNYLTKIYSSRNEELAVTHMFADTVFQTELLELFKEYEERSSIEAKIVKDADNLDVDLEIQEQVAKGNTMRKVWKRKAIRDGFYTKTAKKLWDEIKTSDPHLWHLNAHLKYRKERKYE
jgi:putative hydrolases of HD superfamily